MTSRLINPRLCSVNIPNFSSSKNPIIHPPSYHCLLSQVAFTLSIRPLLYVPRLLVFQNFYHSPANVVLAPSHPTACSQSFFLNLLRDFGHFHLGSYCRSIIQSRFNQKILFKKQKVASVSTIFFFSFET